MRFVQQSAQDSAAAEARLLAMVSGHAQTAQGRAGRAAIAQCDRQTEGCEGVRKRGARDFQPPRVPAEGVVEEGLPASHLPPR